MRYRDGPPSSATVAPPRREMLAAAGSAVGARATGDAVAAAVAGLVGAAPALVLFFPSAEVAAPAAALQAAEAAAGAPAAGMTSNGAYAFGVGPDRGEPACSALAFGPSVGCGIGVADRASNDPRGAGRAAARAALASADPSGGHPLLLLFIDPAAGDQADAIAGAYTATGAAIPFAGGGSGDRDGAQFAAGAAGRDCVVAVLLVSARPLGVGTAHGCTPRGVPAIATRADGQVLLELDGRPAEEVYLERLGIAGARLDDEDFARLAVMHPLAQPELGGDVRLRHVFGRAGRGGLGCATPIRPNAAVAFTAQTVDGIVASAGEAVTRARAALAGARPRAAIVFDSAGRKSALGAALSREQEAIAAALGPDVPVAGGFTHGEVGRVRGAKGDRNHALVVVAAG